MAPTQENEDGSIGSDTLPVLLTFRVPGGRKACFGNWRGAFLASLFLWASVSGALSATNSPPGKSSMVGQMVFNPKTGLDTTVTNLLTDPAGTPTAGATAFVLTADGYAFMVKDVGEKLYTASDPPLVLDIVSQNVMQGTVDLRPGSANNTNTVTFSTELLKSDLDSQLSSQGAPRVVTPPILQASTQGVKNVQTGDGGSNGHFGTLFIPPGSGGDGDSGQAVTVNNTTNITATDQIGIEAGSIGGTGGSGGDSFLNIWDGRDGGNGGAGGMVSVVNATNVQVTTTGSTNYGIFGYSRGGAAGSGGSGFLAPGGGTGGHSSDGGMVGLDNQGTVSTAGEGAHGVYALSVSDNGGAGGGDWGFVGSAGDGGFGGNGGMVAVTNQGSITTSGKSANGILAQSIGGTGGSAGTSGNLLLALQGSADNGGNGSAVAVFNSGSVVTTGTNGSVGIVAQSIGGGGGTGGGSWGLIALGGSGSNGGSGGAVGVTNSSQGSISTMGDKSHGILAQSIGGSGGSGADAGGLVAIGGNGEKAGHGDAVTVENLGSITTQGAHSRGIVAQSIGGGGGDGGSSFGAVSVGGRGGAGGNSSTVTVTHGGTIQTEGDDSDALFVQSIGGGGGNGGTAISVSAFVGVAVGGSGGSGGTGGEVDLTLQQQASGTNSMVHTKGDRAVGVFAQSVGGGGGNGGGTVQVTGGLFGAASIAVGGSGGGGGKGGDVNVANGGGKTDVTTEGNDATGVFVQSVGGGGGNGGYSVAVAAAGGPGAGSLGLAIGGTGGTGGEGGTVNVGSFDSMGTLLTNGFEGNITTGGERSPGFVAQSVGGGGGSGGLAVSVAASGGAGFGGAVGIGIGGSGNTGGHGGNVAVGFSGNITTAEDHSTGMLVQSAGGGGGNGGGSVTVSLAGGGEGAASVSVGIGGSAASGSHGSNVVASTRSGTITTRGEHSTAIIIQSVGGGGGNGGFSIAPAIAGGGSMAGAVSVGVGGNGGGGGSGGMVTADLRSDVNTTNRHSGGVLVQSVGGGGGNGGLTIAGAAAGADNDSGAVSVAVGGSGGDGGSADLVNVSYQGQLTTMGDNSIGFLAQAVGGGGGNAGGTIALSGGTGAVSVGIGTSGGGGGDGGRAGTNAVTANASGSIETSGQYSSGFVAQSIGGGGGNGGFSIAGGGGKGAIAVGIGGSGGQGGDGRDVMATASGTIHTHNSDSSGMLVQSVGGGGGNGGFDVSVTASITETGSGGGIGVGLGGSGGNGGNSGTVTAHAMKDITTETNRSAGFVAQSIGGGGGNGGFNVTADLSKSSMRSGAIGVGLGGSGAGGGTGGAVSAEVSGVVTTKGDMSAGVLAQSVGGGGGNGGFNVSVAANSSGADGGAIGVGLGGSAAGAGDASSVSLVVRTNVTTFGGKSGAVTAQSVGGGGGVGGFVVNVTGSSTRAVGTALGGGSGGSGGGGGRGGSVTNSMTGSISTMGDNSTGLLAQSVGGGGGSGGFDVTATISGTDSGSGTGSVAIGGSGGAGGAAGNVSSVLTGNVTTGGTNSSGVVAQSIGGGGGNGGFVVNGTINSTHSDNIGVSVGVGGFGGAGGDSGSVSNAVFGNVTTTNAGSAGVLAQSVGGGGGNGGFEINGALSVEGSGTRAFSVGVGGSAGGGGSASGVTNTVNGYVQTSGAQAGAVLAQSVGGGGGNGGLNISGVLTASKTGSGGLAVGVGGFGGDGGNAGVVQNTFTGGVMTTSNSSPGIIAQSLGGGGGNGAINVSGALNLSKEGGRNLGVGVGGFGGSGGNAGAVTNTVMVTAGHPEIVTMGNDSIAVAAQSIGGGGGHGGVNVTGDVNLAGDSGAAIGVGVGGFGGGAGDGGKVSLTTTGNIHTRGKNSSGLVAQSIGGGGGHGGVNVTGTLALSKPAGGSANTNLAGISIGVGGFGGAAGNADDVHVSHSGGITATNSAMSSGQFQNGSHGLLAQSIGGGGGQGAIDVSGGVSYTSSGGNAGGIVAGVGGFGGSGGSAGKVDVQVTGGNVISSYGDGRSAIMASSIGGGGGNGAINVSGGVVSDSSLIFGMGGDGGSGGAAGDVTVQATADLVANSRTNNSHTAGGLVAQSVAGGGGNGGLNVTGGLTISKGTNVALNFGVGGSGGSGASSGNVSVTQNGTINTSGGSTHGLLAQSVAGGGGNGALNVSGQLNFAQSKNFSVVGGIGGSGGVAANASNVTVHSTGDVTTSGDRSRGIFAQSIGGGGGTGGMDVTGDLSRNSFLITGGIGGSGAGGGHAGSVTVQRGTSSTDAGKITTAGQGAIGLEAASIGGGGGDAGMNINVGLSSLSGDSETNSGTIRLSIGGSAGSAGNGSAVTVTNFGGIETMSEQSHGILAQSVGGGGGNADYNLAVTRQQGKSKAFGLGVTIGGATGNGGDGGAVRVNHEGNIQTRGWNSYGALAQSIGGGGGNAGTSFGNDSQSEPLGTLALTIGRHGGSGGVGGDVTLTSNGDVTTRGDTSIGLLAQSIGNGGGNSSATSGSISVPTEGTNSTGTLSVSVGLDGGVGGKGGDVNLTAEGSVTTQGDDAHAVFAQSVGGGGGIGGGATGTAFLSSTASFAMGGAGGVGGTGGVVGVANAANLSTTGDRSVGLMAQSIGGGGGAGGHVYGVGIQRDAGSLLVNLGGTGGDGMTGGAVTITNQGSITTDGDTSHGVLAQSLGGGGGNAGIVLNLIASAPTNTANSMQASLSIGRDGGSGAKSGDVTVTNRGAIHTMSSNSVGILAQSIGGGGGNASKVISGIAGIKGGAGDGFNVAIGGSGGSGGAGGNVSVYNLTNTGSASPAIETTADGSHGILAMSIGGGGGNGSMTIAANATWGAQRTNAAHVADVSVGGSGGDGDIGGLVNVVNAAAISTQGEAAHGVIAQSIGGGGGNAGFSFAGQLTIGGGATNVRAGSVSIGRSGGSGNTGGNVNVTNSGSITVSGNKSYGIYAQSIGGGGGDGGSAIAVSSVLTGSATTILKSLTHNLSIGGDGGKGAGSGDVRVEHTGSITSDGDNSYGIFAQSVSGGGGNGGSSYSLPAVIAEELGVSWLVGGNGVSGTNGTITINSTNDITMNGTHSQAKFTQSVNGGGGNVQLFLDVSESAVNQGEQLARVALTNFVGTLESADATGSLIVSAHSGNLTTIGDYSTASATQSIGGGGGNSHSAVVVNSGSSVDFHAFLGASNVTQSSGGNISEIRNGNVTTSGRGSRGSLVQSIGGGGGNLNFLASRVSSPVQTQTSARSPAALTPHAPAAPAGNVTANVALGATQSVGNNGGDMTLNSTGDVSTAGDLAPGQVVQSIGAGGGQFLVTGADALDISVGATGASSGNGGAINLTNVGNITTAGELSHGLVIQSIGGGGGLALTDLAPAAIRVTTNTDNTGNGGAITVNQTGNITVSGNRAVGVLVQSAGGGGGIVDRAFIDRAGGAGDSGPVNITINGNIAANGTDGIGILAQSRASGAQGDITIELGTNNTITYGTNGVGIQFSGGGNNRFINNGTVSGIQGVQGIGILGGDGNETIINRRGFTSDIELGGGVNTVINEGGGTFMPGPEILLGDPSNLLRQDAVLMPGGMDNAQRTVLTGSFLQSAAGQTFSELDFGSANPNVDGGNIDQIIGTGTSSLAGVVNVSLLNPQLVPFGSFQKILFSGAQGVTDNGLTLTTAPSVVITYNLVYPNATEAALDYSVDFAPAGLGPNLRAVGSYFNRVQAAGSSAALASTVTNLLADPNLAAYRQTLTQITPDIYGDLQAYDLHRSQRFGQLMLDEDGYRLMRRGNGYVWFNYLRDNTSRDAFDDYQHTGLDTTGFVVGLETRLNQSWTIGGGYSFEDYSASGYGGRWSAEGMSHRLGLNLERQMAATKIGAVFSYGFNQSDVTRMGNVTAPFQANLSDRQLQTLSAMLRLSHEFSFARAYLRPVADLGYNHLKGNRAAEFGAGALNLEMPEFSENHVWVRPALDGGFQFEVSDDKDLVLRLYGSLGMQFYLSDPETSVTAGLQGAPAGVSPMFVPVELGQSQGQATIGIALTQFELFSVGLSYTKFLSQHRDVDIWSVNMAVAF